VLKETYFSFFNINKVFQNFVWMQWIKPPKYLGAHVGLKISNMFSLVMLCIMYSFFWKMQTKLLSCSLCCFFAALSALICLVLLHFANRIPD